jgi:hypothetical protein
VLYGAILYTKDYYIKGGVKQEAGFKNDRRKE